LEQDLFLKRPLKLRGKNGSDVRCKQFQGADAGAGAGAGAGAKEGAQSADTSFTNRSTVSIKPKSVSGRYGDISCAAAFWFALLCCGCHGEQGRYSVVTTALPIAAGDVALRWEGRDIY
jgi:hypothetical protein